MVVTNPDVTRRALMFASRKLRVIQWDYGIPLIESVHDETTGALELPADGTPIGLLDKAQASRLANSITINDIRSHGEGGPTRQIPQQRDVTIGLNPQETNRANLENWWGIDLSSVVPDASGAVTFGVESLPEVFLKRTVVYAKDTYQGLPWCIAVIGNRTNVSDRSEQSTPDSEVPGYPYTLNFQGEDALGGQPVIVDIFGAGWAAIQDAGVDTGFGAGS
ncbi:MAG: hypothetical protein K2Y33_09320 [Mycolicibacterium frederiksbergense]|nr:hypothetical protein [Mycolicibacterium frederiksbergense]